MGLPDFINYFELLKAVQHIQLTYSQLESQKTMTVENKNRDRETEGPLRFFVVIPESGESVSTRITIVTL